MGHRHLRLWLVLVVVLGTVSLATAQETTGTVVGTVTDDSGAVLPGVTVVLRHTGTGQTFERVTSAEGFYTAPLLPIGTYEATFTLNGFQQRIVRGIALSVNDRLQIDIRMSVGGVTEVIEVTSPQSVQPTAALQSLIGAAQVQELPINNRNFAQLAMIAPGVSSDMSAWQSRPISGDLAKHQQHAPGSGPSRLRLERQMAAHGTIHA